MRDHLLWQDLSVLLERQSPQGAPREGRISFITVTEHVHLYKVLQQAVTTLEAKCLPWFKPPQAKQHQPLQGDLPATQFFLAPNLVPFGNKSSPLLIAPRWGVFLMALFTDPSFGF